MLGVAELDAFENLGGDERINMMMKRRMGRRKKETCRENEARIRSGTGPETLIRSASDPQSKYSRRMYLCKKSVKRIR
jgi:hypothetical protein